MELSGLISKASFIIANDTGPAHIAAHLGKEGLVLFGQNGWTAKFENSTARVLFPTPPVWFANRIIMAFSLSGDFIFSLALFASFPAVNRLIIDVIGDIEYRCEVKNRLALSFLMGFAFLEVFP